MKYILGIGSPCVDLIYHVDDAFLKLLPINKGDEQTTSPEVFNTVLETCRLHQYLPKMFAGGSCSNTIKGLANLDNSTAFMGKIGRDAAGDFYRSSLMNLTIHPLLIPTEFPTTRIAVFITPDTQRSFLACLGAGQQLSPQDVDTLPLNQIRHLHIEGYALDRPAVVEKAMQHAKSVKATISLDMGCMRIVRSFSPTIIHLLKTYVDIVFTNEDEAQALTELPAKESCIHLASLCPIALVLVGARGSWSASGKKIIHSPAPKVNAIDTTGAGDLFNCGFLHGYLQGKSIEECARLGNLLGSTAVTVDGAEIPPDHWPKIKQSI